MITYTNNQINARALIGQSAVGYVRDNTDVRGIYLTYFMKLFMKDLYIAILCSRGETPAN